MKPPWCVMKHLKAADFYPLTRYHWVVTRLRDQQNWASLIILSLDTFTNNQLHLHIFRLGTLTLVWLSDPILANGGNNYISKAVRFGINSYSSHKLRLYISLYTKTYYKISTRHCRLQKSSHIYGEQGILYIFALKYTMHAVLLDRAFREFFIF